MGDTCPLIIIILVCAFPTKDGELPGFTFGSSPVRSAPFLCLFSKRCCESYCEGEAKVIGNAS